MSKLSTDIVPIIADIRKQRKTKTYDELSELFAAFKDPFRVLFDIVSNKNETEEERGMVEFLISKLAELDADKSKEFNIGVDISTKLADKYIYNKGFEKPSAAKLEEHTKKLKEQFDEIKADPSKIKDVSWKET